MNKFRFKIYRFTEFCAFISVFIEEPRLTGIGSGYGEADK
jgi:hypothetical protein